MDTRLTVVDATTVQEWLLETQRARLTATIKAATEVSARHASCFESELQAKLESRGLLSEYAALLTELRSACDGRDEGPQIVPKPPYVTVTSRGPLLRLTAPSERIVICLAIRRVTEDGTYVRRRLNSVGDLATVEIRATPT